LYHIYIIELKYLGIRNMKEFKIADCYSLDVECSPKVLCVKGLFPRVALLGDSGTFRRWGIMNGPEVMGGVPLKRTVGSGPSFLFCFQAMN
jgi:hypothetical protein